MKAGNLIQVPTKGFKQLLLRSSAGPLLLPVGCGMQQGEEGRKDEVSCGIRKISGQSTVSRTSMAEARKLSAMSSAMVGVDNSDLIVPSQSMSTASAVERRLGSLQEQELQQTARSLVPRLTHSLHKGECGRVAVFGGCVMYTGAPYFAAISALKSGADLVHIFCEKDAGTVIKSYSPELIVHPVLDQEYGIEDIEVWLPRLHCVLLGPGLGRNQSTLGRMSLVLEKAKNLNLPIVVDADALWQVNQNPALVQGYPKAVLTPNAMEFSRLVKAVLHREVAPSGNPDPSLVAEVAAKLGHVTILHKGLRDVISDGRDTVECGAAGSPRRCGGQGDLLAGSLATFLHWALNMSQPSASPLLAAWAAARLARGCGEQAFGEVGRAVTTTDMVSNIHPVFNRLYEGETSL